MDDTATAELLAQAAWARRLARRLVADEARADDLLQQAWLAALRRRSDAIRSSARAWFGGVLRNVAAKQRRESARRDARERVAATAEVQPTAADHVAELEAQRLIVDALLKVDEPYRETLVRRWYRDEKSAAIARAMRVPVKTVETRLARGLERLRAELVALRGGGPREWSFALLPLAASEPAKWVVLGGLAGGGLAVGTIVKFAAAAALVIAGLWWATRGDDTRSTRGTDRDGGVASATAPATEPTAASAATRSKDGDVGVRAEKSAFVGALTARVTDDAGGPVDGKAFLFDDREGYVDEPVNDGVVSFACPRRASRLLIVPGTGRLTGSAPACFDVPAGTHELAVALPRGAVLSGRVLCDGRPPGVSFQMWFTPNSQFRSMRDAPPFLQPHLGPPQAACVQCDEEGRFRFAGLEEDVAGTLTIERGFSTKPIRLTSGGALDLSDTLPIERPSEGLTIELYSPPAIVGRVVDASGAPCDWWRLEARFDAGEARPLERFGMHGSGGRFRVHLPASGVRAADLKVLVLRRSDVAQLRLEGPFVGTRDVGDVTLVANRTIRATIVTEGDPPQDRGDVLLTGPAGARHTSKWSGRDVVLEVPSPFTRASFVALGCLSREIELPAESNATPIEVVLERAASLEVRLLELDDEGELSADSQSQLNVEIATRGRLVEPPLDDPEVARRCCGRFGELDSTSEPGWTVATFYRTDATLSGVVAGVPLRVRVVGVTGRVLAERTIVLGRGESHLQQISLADTRRTFVARVVDESGAPIQSATVSVRPIHPVRFGGIGTSTDADGRVRFEEYFDDEGEVVVEADGFVPLHREPVRIGGGESFEYRLQRCWPLAVDVVDQKGLRVEPERVDAIAITELGAPKPKRIDSKRAADGAFQLQALPPVPVRVRATVGGRDYFVDVEPPRSNIQLVVPAHGRVDVRYTLPLAEHADRGELLNAIELVPADDRGARVATEPTLFSPQRPAGSVVFPAVLPGRYEAQLVWRDERSGQLRREPTGVAFDVAAGATSEVALAR